MNKIHLIRRLATPLTRFIQNSSFSAVLLFLVTFLAFVLANTPAHEHIQKILSTPIGFHLNGFKLNKPFILWINDGLMSIFFFVVGLELKREIVAGELSKPQNALLPIMAAIGGMLFPALIYIGFNLNSSSDAIRGWGVPMCTDIAFSLGVLLLLGSQVPMQLKVFLTAVAIIDDIGAVTVIALFYSSEISFENVMIGFFFLSLMAVGNWIGVRSVLFYGVLGIGGVWLAFLLSGVHATVAGVLSAFAIPASRSINKDDFLEKLQSLTQDFKESVSSRHERYLVSPGEENIINEVKKISNYAISPLQKLEHSMHPLVAFAVIPIFALANAGIPIRGDWFAMATSPVALGSGVGLLVGKIAGIYGVSIIGIKLGWFAMPAGVNNRMILGTSFLAAIGFTMSLFITSLAFENPIYAAQAKMGILLASLVAGICGFLILKLALPRQ
ncbi:MAG TPA: Na+/H+ antiporter NhaA [Planctomycetaceae bacterium]|nr:Na+/H+ antiporter NhaA [Planctomycetaceae bacterium]